MADKLEPETFLQLLIQNFFCRCVIVTPLTDFVLLCAVMFCLCNFDVDMKIESRRKTVAINLTRQKTLAHFVKLKWLSFGVNA